MTAPRKLVLCPFIDRAVGEVPAAGRSFMMLQHISEYTHRAARLHCVLRVGKPVGGTHRSGRSCRPSGLRWLVHLRLADFARLHPDLRRKTH